MAEQNNLFISGTLAALPQLGPMAGSGSKTAVLGPEVPPSRGDSFTQGEWWKNQAGARPENDNPLDKIPPFGVNPKYVAGLYTQQAKQGKAPGQPSTPADIPPGQDSKPAATEIENKAAGSDRTKPAETTEDETSAAKPGEPTTPQGRPLKPSERFLLMELQSTDIKVKAHENAHLAAAGPYATTAANYTYARGPDGNLYAVGGEVGIDTSEERTPESTISKMRVVQQAALAPADPSPQDRSIAAAATSKMIDAYSQIQKMRGEAAAAAATAARKSSADQTTKASQEATDKSEDIGMQTAGEMGAGQGVGTEPSAPVAGMTPGGGANAPANPGAQGPLSSRKPTDRISVWG